MRPHRLVGVTTLLFGLAVFGVRADQTPPYPFEPRLVEVMFEEWAGVEAIDGAPESSQVPLREHLAEALPAGMDWRWTQLAPLPTKRLARIHALAEANGAACYDFRGAFLLSLPDGERPENVSVRLERLKEVRSARPVPLPVPPPAPPDYTGLQNYLDAPTGAPPTGSGVRHAWTFPGGDGAGVTIVDIEYSWNVNHRELADRDGILLNDQGTRDPFDDTSHGTAVLGCLGAAADGTGITGVAAGATLRARPAYFGTPVSWNPAGAILDAVSVLKPGDVILLEQQARNSGGLAPLEIWTDAGPATRNIVYEAIATATALGIFVVEAAGNGGQDLDPLQLLDSGAILVGAGGAYPGGPIPAGDLERCSFSNFGSAVRVQGWGEDVATLAYGDLYNAEGANSSYTAEFAGTSSASAITAGLVACCWGYWKARGGDPRHLPARTLREIFWRTGTGPRLSGDGGIGRRPDLRAAFAELDRYLATSRTLLAGWEVSGLPGDLRRLLLRAYGSGGMETPAWLAVDGTVVAPMLSPEPGAYEWSLTIPSAGAVPGSYLLDIADSTGSSRWPALTVLP